jgi:hypothetical protein
MASFAGALEMLTAPLDVFVSTLNIEHGGGSSLL